MATTTAWAEPTFPLAAKELATWSRFASKGGLGTGRAKCDNVAAAEGDLMFLNNEDIIILLRLSNGHEYLGCCEGVIGKLPSSSVEITTKLKRLILAPRSPRPSRVFANLKSPPAELVSPSAVAAGNDNADSSSTEHRMPYFDASSAYHLSSNPSTSTRSLLSSSAPSASSLSNMAAEPAPSSASLTPTLAADNNRRSPPPTTAEATSTMATTSCSPKSRPKPGSALSLPSTPPRTTSRSIHSTTPTLLQQQQYQQQRPAQSPLRIPVPSCAQPHSHAEPKWATPPPRTSSSPSSSSPSSSSSAAHRRPPALDLSRSLSSSMYPQRILLPQLNPTSPVEGSAASSSSSSMQHQRYELSGSGSDTLPASDAIKGDRLDRSSNNHHSVVVVPSPRQYTTPPTPPPPATTPSLPSEQSERMQQEEEGKSNASKWSPKSPSALASFFGRRRSKAKKDVPPPPPKSTSRQHQPSISTSRSLDYGPRGRDEEREAVQEQSQSMDYANRRAAETDRPSPVLPTPPSSATSQATGIAAVSGSRYFISAADALGDTPANEIAWLLALDTLSPKVARGDRKLRASLIKSGIASRKRGRVWMYLAEARGERIEGLFLLLKTRPKLEVYDAVEKDMEASFLDHPYFAGGSKGRSDLLDILKAFAQYDRQLGYCPGLATMAGTILLQLLSDSTDPPEDTFLMLIALVKRYGFHRYFVQENSDDALARRAMRVDSLVLAQLLEQQDKKLSKKLAVLQVDLSCLMMWFCTPLLPWSTTLRLLDLLFFDPSAHFPIALALLRLSRSFILDSKPTPKTKQDVVEYWSKMADQEEEGAMMSDAVLGTVVMIKEEKLGKMMAKAEVTVPKVGKDTA